ncbi:uncharacterized protein LOC144121932 isoform X2 [Amblyomma americanum]
MSRCTRDCGALCSPAPVSTTASAYLLRCERQSTHRSAIQKSWEPSSWTGWAGPARKTIICRLSSESTHPVCTICLIMLQGTLSKKFQNFNVLNEKEP